MPKTTTKSAAAAPSKSSAAKVAAKAAPAAKKNAAAAPKKTPAPAPKKTTEAAAPRAKKDGLRKPQVRILAALAKAPKGLTRKQIAEKAPVDLAFCTEYIGSSDPEIRAKNDDKFMSLLSLGHVRAEQHPNGDGKAATVYLLTAAGKKALADASK